MKFNYRIAFGALAAATLLVTTPLGSQGKRVIDMKAPVMNEKEIKVECVHVAPHMMLRNKTKETGVFSVTTQAQMTATDCAQDDQGRFIVEPGKRCMLMFNSGDIGKAVTQVSAETSTTRYIFRGEWPVYVCCRGKYDPKLYQSSGPFSKETFDVLLAQNKNRSAQTGNLYRGYAVTILPDRIDNHNREKGDTNPLTMEGNFSSRPFARGVCADDK